VLSQPHTHHKVYIVMRLVNIGSCSDTNACVWGWQCVYVPVRACAWVGHWVLYKGFKPFLPKACLPREGGIKKALHAWSNSWDSSWDSTKTH